MLESVSPQGISGARGCCSGVAEELKKKPRSRAPPQGLKTLNCPNHAFRRFFRGRQKKTPSEWSWFKIWIVSVSTTTASTHGLAPQPQQKQRLELT